MILTEEQIKADNERWKGRDLKQELYYLSYAVPNRLSVTNDDLRFNAFVARKALGMIENIQPQPCEDVVSRKAVKDGFVEMCNLICPYTEKQRHAMCGSCLLGTAFDVLEATQSVTPKQRWIPVIERLPEKQTKVLVVDFCEVDTAYLNSEGRWMDFNGDKLKDVKAWMPLPKWEGEVE